MKHRFEHARRLEDYAKANGWVIKKGKNSFHLSKSGKRTIYVSKTPSCKFATEHALADLRREDRKDVEQREDCTSG